MDSVNRKGETAISDDKDYKKENSAADDTIELGDDGPEPDKEPEKKNTSRHWRRKQTAEEAKTIAREEIEQKKEEMKDKRYKEKVDLLRAMVEALQNKN
ncbi:Hypothetical predicted protein [Mytilus galloprovincialis]|uniref:Uncharacterized protein n=1 Tax=Mytilus galloprovincialis TaxID=29158 RepID=A0A8B6BSH8_MYTGA|nr:Hypothetical predicted protein [Mytilus galloprovincialis]